MARINKIDLQTSKYTAVYWWGAPINDPEVINLELLNSAISNYQSFKSNGQSLYNELKSKVTDLAEGVMVVDGQDVLLPFMENTISQFQRILDAFDNIETDKMRKTAKATSLNHINLEYSNVQAYRDYIRQAKSELGNENIFNSYDHNRFSDEIDRCNDDLLKLNYSKSDFI